MPALRDLQAGVLDALLGGTPGTLPDGKPGTPPGGTPDALRGGTPDALPGWGADSAEMQARFDVYVNTVRTNFLGSLRSTYPVVLRLVGEAYFRGIGLQYQNAHPSTSGDLLHVGRDFPGYLAERHGGDAYAYLADVARLEWLCENALLAADHAPLDLQALAEVDAAAYDALRFRLHPSTALFESRFPILRIWRANLDTATDPEFIDLSQGADRLVILRVRGRLEFLALSPGEWAFLEALRSDTALAEAVAGAVGIDSTFEAGAALRRFVAANAIVGFEHPHGTHGPHGT